jgi:6,7-dimethyl-8-ribityllumazine synthase
MVIQPSQPAASLRVAVVCSRFNEEVTRKLLEGAVQRLGERGVPKERVDVALVPGAFEIPGMAKRLIDTGRYGAIVAIGAVIRGDTPHFDYICDATAHAIMRLTVDTGVPVAFGVLTCDTDAQAEARAGGSMGNKGVEAADAALDMADLYSSARTLRG